MTTPPLPSSVALKSLHLHKAELGPCTPLHATRRTASVHCVRAEYSLTAPALCLGDTRAAVPMSSFPTSSSNHSQPTLPGPTGSPLRSRVSLHPRTSPLRGSKHTLGQGVPSRKRCWTHQTAACQRLNLAHASHLHQDRLEMGKRPGWKRPTVVGEPQGIH